MKKLVKKALTIPKTKTLKVKAREDIDYLDGGHGCCKWIEDYCHASIIPIGETTSRWVRIGNLPDTMHPETGKSYKQLWEAQKEILIECLEMRNGEFIYNLLVFCWMRGEGKSFIVCLIQLWKFFNFTKQTITLGANSRDQVQFVHFDIMKDIIINSPELYAIVGNRNIQQKEIRFKNANGHIISRLKPISSFSGIVSNITGYTFSEIFDMKNPKFFVQLDGSIRNMSNAIGAIDSTVSEKNHVLYQMYDNWRVGKTKRVFYSYRFSRLGEVKDYWNPRQTQDQLDDYRIKFPFGEFERYFLNLWEAGKQTIFTPEMIEEVGVFGIDNMRLNHIKVKESIAEKHRLKLIAENMRKKKLVSGVIETANKIHEIDERMNLLDDTYSLVDSFGQNQMATMVDLQNLSDILETDWVIGAGLDFADPMATRGKARTILTVYAKGLPQSRTKVSRNVDADSNVKYYYFLLYAVVVDNDSVNTMRDELENVHNEFDLDVVCTERYGAWDLVSWCEEKDIKFDPIFPNYDKQREAFKELYASCLDGRFKIPTLVIPGSKSDNIWVEEATIFHHDQDKRVFGSPEKFEKYGIQDDFMYGSAWSLFGMRLLGVDDFRPRSFNPAQFGMFIPNTELLGRY